MQQPWSKNLLGSRLYKVPREVEILVHAMLRFPLPRSLHDPRGIIHLGVGGQRSYLIQKGRCMKLQLFGNSSTVLSNLPIQWKLKSLPMAPSTTSRSPCFHEFHFIRSRWEIRPHAAALE
ncbi:hypothetical protein CDAR_444121 [Caerostris darwini]|uniref:Ycf15 n=1 Tax=Caerostris darwini TaxID=1538125 RepID=A0AAV4X963_9ARAC|nr:hypothetical protein CDAR_444121 [Caerostris darwini]